MKDFKLDSEPKIATGFTTPDHYFDTVSNKVLLQLSIEKPKVISIFNNAKKLYYAAAAVIILSISIAYLIDYETYQQQPDDLTLENYISYQSTVSQDEIESLLDQEDIETLKTELNISNL
jgi:cell division protein FtsL